MLHSRFISRLCICLVSFLHFHPLLAYSYSHQDYLELLKQHPNLGPNGSHRDGEVEIVTDLDEIRRIENECYERYLKNGMDAQSAKVASQAGILAQDPYWIVMRDAVIFPSGTKGLFNRVIQRTALDQPVEGTVCAALLPDGRILAVLHHRHATRSWELELPRGGKISGESIEQTAIRQTSEETGYRLQNPQLLGYLAGDSSVASGITAVMAGFVKEKRSPKLDDTEAIKGVLALTKTQLTDALQKGWIEIKLSGHPERVHVRDPAFAYVILIAGQKGIWH
jgi:ADP-ribose pyrophosphatase